MKCLVGLGNPGTQYETTRHNIGFMAIDAWVKENKLDWKVWGQSKNMLLAQKQVGDEKIIVVKPLTYMNRSGIAVAEALSFFKVAMSDLCVAHDELDLDFGDVRLKRGGGEGGHNGLRSLAEHLPSNAYARVRMGIGHPRRKNSPQDVADYVLSRFDRSEERELHACLDQVVEAFDAFIQGEKAFLKLMNRLNQKKAASTPTSE